MPVVLRSGKSAKKVTTEGDDFKEKKNNENAAINQQLRRMSSEDLQNSNAIELPNLEGDYFSISILLFLYVLQGIPLGLAASIPMILQNKNVSYKQQALFSFVYWPFSLKLLWAPIVDSLFVRRIGRRKSWIVPAQYIIAFFLVFLSMQIDSILNSDVPDVLYLTIVFFTLNFLAATQDIAVDGWALTMLKRRNVGYASTCNSVGQTAGYFVGNVVLLAFSSAEFCNKYIRQVPQDVGLITLSGFLFFWGIMFLVSTTMILLFKHEDTNSSCGDTVENHGIIGTYKMLFKVVQLPAVQELVLIVMTIGAANSAANAVTGLKLIEAGVKKETLALLAVPLVPLQIILPFCISRFIAGRRLLDMYVKAVPFRLFMNLLFPLGVYWTRHLNEVYQGDFPNYYYAVILLLYSMRQIAAYFMFVPMLTFHSKICDPLIGGTYMTLLTTLGNLGNSLPMSLALYFVDILTSKQCSDVVGNNCGDSEKIKLCSELGGKCNTVMDGYYIECAICFVYGIVWLLWKRGTIMRIQHYKQTAWRVK